MTGVAQAGGEDAPKGRCLLKLTQFGCIYLIVLNPAPHLGKQGTGRNFSGVERPESFNANTYNGNRTQDDGNHH
jgi:hypothetical protein